MKGLLAVECTVSGWVLMEVLGRGLTKLEVISLTAERLLAAQKDL